MDIKLPKQFIPKHVKYKKVQLGLDFPSWFFYDLKAIDKDFHLVWHKNKTLWENIMNLDEGPLEDPRYTVNYDYGELNFGWVLTDNKGYPARENQWHLYRLCHPHGWAHVMCIEDKHPEYLKLLVKRLHLQARFTDRYGFKSWTHKLDEDQGEITAKEQRDKEDLYNAFQEENSWFMRKAKENYERGIINPTRPKKEIISSFAGQTHRTKIVRDLTDEEGGLYTGN